jgi:hypothetical protein
MGEGYRKMHFRKGFNNLLVGIENGPGSCVWSVVLCPPDALDKQPGYFFPKGNLIAP